ncbi:MAG: right-handed parallel beta-helix repeat-containing protein, partial [Planctomycetes bacterium]|nr:right-handed parallel beta-helix repeat-containing protein [Planctomycetota bacterium]
RFCKARHAQNGALLREVTGAQIHDNDFSFLSGWGIALFDSSDCTVAHNATEYNVRGYSHGAYAVGHNSAGILVAGASDSNEIAFNRASHCGTGVSIWGRRGEQGQPSNTRVLGNDCSVAIQAGIQNVRSADTLIQNNRIEQCLGYGIRGQADRGAILLGNQIEGTQGRAIALHGSHSAVVFQNQVKEGQVGLEISLRGPKGHDTVTDGTERSEEHFVVGNQFEDNGQDLVASDSDALSFAGNRFVGGRQRLHVQGIRAWGEESTTQGSVVPTPGEDTVVGWLAGSNGVMPTGSMENVSLLLWNGELPSRLAEAQGLEAPEVPGHPKSSKTVRTAFDGGHDTVVLGKFGPWDFPSGEPQTQMRKPGGLFSGVNWKARWFAFDPESQDPRGDVDAWRSLASEPLLEAEVEHFLDPRPTEEIAAQVPSVRFGLIAETTIDIDHAGEYQLSVMSDDGIRLWLGDEIVFEDWSWHAIERKQITLQLKAGPRKARLEYFQLDGAAELALELHAK